MEINMKMLKRLTGSAEKLKSGVQREVGYLGHVLQGLILIAILDELYLVKLTGKRLLIRSIMSRKHHLYSCKVSGGSEG